MNEIIIVCRAFFDAPFLSQLICIFILFFAVYFYFILRKGLRTLDHRLQEISLYLKSLSRNAAADPIIMEEIAARFKKDAKLYHHWQEYFESVSHEQVDERNFLKATQPASAYFGFDNLVHAIDWKLFKFEMFAAVPGGFCRKLKS